jgi:arylsulfatase A-like enzyme
MLESYGDSTVATPNISRLAREGVRYSNVFSVAGVCAPSRAGLISGMYPTSFGANNMRTLQNIADEVPYYSVVPPPEMKTHSEYLRRAGYYCTNNVKTDFQFETPVSAFDDCSTKAHWRNRPAGKPFFSIVNFTITHESQVWNRKNEPMLGDPERVKVPPFYPDTETVRKDIARTYSNIVRMDEAVGQVLKELEEDGLLDKTIVFFYSDHGSGLPFYKRELYDRGLKVPLIIRYPDKAGAGTWNDELISFVDFAPTLLSLADVRIPEHMQGQAFLGPQKAKQPRRYVFAARDRMDSEYDMVRAVSDGRFKYIRNYQPQKPVMQNIAFRMNIDMMNELLRMYSEGKLTGHQLLWFRKSKPVEEFYDTRNDPFELNNLIDDPRIKEKLNELRSAHQQWERDTKDMGFIPEREVYLSMWPDGVQPTTRNVDIVYDRKNARVSLRCSESGASIVYRTSKQDSTWQLYTDPFQVKSETVVSAMAIRYGYRQSAESTLAVP